MELRLAPDRTFDWQMVCSLRSLGDTSVMLGNSTRGPNRFRRLFRVLAIAVFFPTASAFPAPPARWDVEAWKAADKLFRGDPCWVGGDGAYSVDLGKGRFLWLFGDSLIDPTGSHSRKSAGVKMIGNSVAIQTGSDPATAKIRYYWKTARDRSPAAFFPDRGRERFWPGDGIRIRDHLLLFLMRVKTIPGGLGFEVCGWDAVLIRNPDDAPPDWKMTWLETPSNNLHVIVGSAGVLRDGGFVYAFGSKEPGGASAYFVRWPESEGRNGNLLHAQWWDGRGWSGKEPEENNAAATVLRGAGSEFTVHRDPETGKFVMIHSAGFGPADIVMREAARPQGPWSAPERLYRPPEARIPRIMIYQAKAHPGLTGADLVLTYSTNSLDIKNLFEEEDIYYPRFVRVFNRAAATRQ